MTTLVMHDDTTGPRMWSKLRTDPAGKPLIQYRFDVDPPRGMPGHLGSIDPFDLKANLDAFERIIEYLKANPE